MGLRLIVTGSQDYHDRGQVWHVLNGLYNKYGSVLVVHGACPRGGDWHAELWAENGRRHGQPVDSEPWPANWRLYGDGAGPVRNKAMVKAGGDLLVAFFAPPPALNEGTAGCVELARTAGIKVVEYGRETPATETWEQETLPL